MKNYLVKILRKENTSYVSLFIGLIFISLVIAFGLIASLYLGYAFKRVEACVENIFLFICLLIIVLAYKNDKLHIVESLMGELLAINVVTNACRFVETIIDIIKNGIVFVDYIDLILDLLVTITAILVFLDHLIRSDKEKEEEKHFHIITLMILIVLITMMFDIILIFSTSNIEHMFFIIEELLFISFGLCLSLAVLSSELRRVQKKN